MKRKEIPPPQSIIPSEALVSREECIHGFARSRAEVGANRVAIDVRVLDDEIRADGDEILVMLDLLEDVRIRMIGIERNQCFALGDERMHLRERFRVHRAAFDQPDAWVSNLPRRRRELDVNPDDEGVSVGCDEVEEVREEEDRSTSA